MFILRSVTQSRDSQVERRSMMMKGFSAKLVYLENQLAIIGVPVYAGRVPLEAIHRLQRLKARGAPAVIVVLYGNRAYEDALLELRDLAVGLGFTAVAAGAFIGEHSFANETTPIASGRPDSDDLTKAREFGRLVRSKLEKIHELHRVPPLMVPGNFPYRERGTALRLPPESQRSLCTRCGTCSTVCPTAAITIGDTVVTDGTSCISCCACVKSCPAKARIVVDLETRERAARLSRTCTGRKEPEIYL
jgi:ferredoxin